MGNVVTEGNRVRKFTSERMNIEVDELIYENIKKYAGKSSQEISERIKELDAEWDIERLLELNMSSIAITGLVLSGLNRRFLMLPAVVLGFFLQHAVQGWCPPLTLFRAMKVRTRDEIAQEKHALKALRGDYKDVKNPGEAFIAARKVDE